MLPPQFNDWKRWVQFRRNINYIFKLHQIVSSTRFKNANSLLIILAFVIGLLSLYTSYEAFNIIDDVLIVIFVI